MLRIISRPGSLVLMTVINGFLKWRVASSKWLVGGDSSYRLPGTSYREYNCIRFWLSAFSLYSIITLSNYHIITFVAYLHKSYTLIGCSFNKKSPSIEMRGATKTNTIIIGQKAFIRIM
jgi:hypothetical protein